MNFQRLVTDLESRGLTQTEIAGLIGVTQGRISQVKNDAKSGFRGLATVKLIELHAARHLRQAAA